MSGNTRYSEHIWFTLILLCSAQLQCGGKQTPESRFCHEKSTQILSKSDDEVCDPARISFFEIQVMKWQEDCSEQARGPLGEKVSHKFLVAQHCSEKKRQVEQKRVDCNERLEKAERELGCLGDECVPYQYNLNEIAKDCDTPALNQDFSKKINELQQRIRERINEADRLQATTEIIILCNQYVEITSEKRAVAAYNQMLQKVTDDPFIHQVPQKGSEVDWLRKEALSTCDQSLLLTLEVILPSVSKKLDNTSHHRRKKRAMAKLTAMRKRMADADGASLFPNADALLDRIVHQYTPQAKSDVIAPKNIEKNIPEPTVQAKREIVAPKNIEKNIPEPTVQAKRETVVPKRIKKKEPKQIVRVPLLMNMTKSGDTDVVSDKEQKPAPPKPAAPKPAPPKPAPPIERTAAQDRDYLMKSENRCRELRNDSAYFFAKVAKYRKKNSKNKISLYQSNLDNTNKALQALSTEIKKIVESTTLPSYELENLLKNLKKLGCLRE
jgi:hypothetical protein